MTTPGTPSVMRKNALKAGWMKPRYVLTQVNRKTCNRGDGKVLSKRQYQYACDGFFSVFFLIAATNPKSSRLTDHPEKRVP